MGKPTGFMEFTRELPGKKPVQERIQNYNEFIERYSDEKLNQQAARCMDCGIPFCHSGCPLGNVIPEFNDAVYQKNWQEAYDILTSTNNFPEFTGRICPLPAKVHVYWESISPQSPLKKLKNTSLKLLLIKVL
jgi:glutamate synthase (NADPH/NADH) small chain